MKRNNRLCLGKVSRLLLSLFVVLNAVSALLIPMGTVSAADTGGAVSAAYQVEINETTGSDGFTHPGVGLTKDILETMRAGVQEQTEPWYSYYQAMTLSSAASKTVTSSNASSSDPTKPAVLAFNSQSFNSKFIADSLKAYTQAILYYVTGDETYRANAMTIIRIWSQMDPLQYKNFTDSHIHTGIPLNRMVTAAEILRYSSYQTAELQWTDKDTTDFTTNLINPVIETFMHDQNHFMNQHSYPLIGAIAGYIFTDNRDRYNEAVEWWTVNKTAADQGFNGSIKQLFRLIDTNALTGEKLEEPVIQHVEMGRDQAHGGGDLTNSIIISRMLLAQGTTIDPEDGTVSKEADAVGPYEFLNDRILAAANYFWQYMLGYDTPWTPVAYSIAADGTTRDTYNQLASSYRGRFNTANFWDLYSYYTYVKGVNVAEVAPYYYEAFTKKLPPNYYYGEGLNINWDNVDGGGDFWLYLPEEAGADSVKWVPKAQTSPFLIEIEDRYTSLDNNTETVHEGDTSFVRFNATETGSKIALLNASSSKKTIGFRFRTNGLATLELTPGINDTVTLPDTNGQWRYVTYTMGNFQALGDIVYLNVTGANTTVDIDHLNVQAGTQLTPPVFVAGNTDMNLFAFTGAPIQIDFSATDSNSTDVVAYDSTNLPGDAQLNTNTGAFSWLPAQAGTYSFNIMASDGTTVTSKNINIVVTSDRASAVQAAITPFDPDAIYVTGSLNYYNAIYNDTISGIDRMSDEEFIQQLQTLRSTTEKLELVTPALKLDGSIDYHDIVTSSTFGTSIVNLVDGNNTTGFAYTLAPYPNLYHILDFGPDYKVTATSFGFQSNIFADRLAKSAVFGSNNKETWTRLTPGLTAFTQSFQTLDVADEYKNTKFRFIKIQLLDPQPDIIHNLPQNMFEMTEFRIYGQRYEIGNKLESVSIGSDSSISGKIALGDTVKLTIKAREAIQNVNVSIQGVNATVSTEDHINWTAEAAMAGNAPTGVIKFTVDYEWSDGTKGDSVVLTTDNSKLFLVDSSKFIDVKTLATVTASDKQWPGTGLSKEQVGYLLFDGNTATAGDLNTSIGSYYTVSFGEHASVKLNEIVLMPRTGNSARMNGLIVQGSNDNSSWTNLTEPLKGSTEGEWSDIKENQILDHSYYHYFRLYNSSAWSGNVAEVEFYGDLDYDLDYVNSKVVAPDGYTKGSYYLYMKEVERIMAAMNQQGANKTELLLELTQAKSLLVSIVAITEKMEVIPSMVTSSGVSYDGTANAAQNGWRAFDGDISTSPDTKTSLGWIRVDLGTGNEQTIGSIKFLPRNGNYNRMNGAIIQGSADGVSFDNLYTISGVTSAKWYDAVISNDKAYRYLRYYSPNGNANVAELEFYKITKDKTLLTILLQKAEAIESEKYTEETVADLAAAVTEATLVNGSANASQAEINTAAANLKESLEGLELLKVNQTPVFEAIAPITVSAGSTVTFTVYASDGDDKEVTYSALSLPDGASFDAAKAQFTWIPTLAGAYAAVVKAVDSHEGEATLDVPITVTNAVIASATLKGPTRVSVGEEVYFSIGVTGLESSFTTLDLIVHYDPAKLNFVTQTDEDGRIILDDTVLSSSREGFGLLGTGVKPELGQIRIIMSSTGVNHPVNGDGEVLKIYGKVTDAFAEGMATVSLSDFSVSDHGVPTALDTTNATVELSISAEQIDKAALNTAISEAQRLHDGAAEGSAAGQYPAGAKAAFQTAINEAKVTQANESATQQQVNAALASLTTAVNIFEASVNTGNPPVEADKAALIKLIYAAQVQYDQAVEGIKVGKYETGAKAALQAAISAAQIVRNQNAATQAETDSTVLMLNSAVESFAKKLITLIPGETKISINDLSILAAYFGVKSGDVNWSGIAAADIFDENEITIRSLAAIAQMIIGDWLKE